MTDLLAKQKDRIFRILLFLYLYYYSYRYLFQINAESTSPTYSDTPLFLQLPKYILVFGLMVILLVQKNTIGYNHRNRTVGMVLLFWVFQFFLIGVITKNTVPITIALLASTALFYLREGEYLDFLKAEKLFISFWYFSATYELIQIILYVLCERLPALGYATGKLTDVRFGGAWDDPNGYALLMAFYVFYFLFRYKGIKQLAFLGATLLMLLLTWSGTGVIAFGATVAIILLIRFSDRFAKRRILFWCSIGFIVLTAFCLMKWDWVVQELNYFLNSKQGSIEGHQADFDTSWISVPTMMGVSPDYHGTEVGYLRILSIGGLPAVIAFIWIGWTAISRFQQAITNANQGRTLPDKRKNAFLYACMAYCITFMLSMINLPEIINFSCMGVFMSCVILSLHTESFESEKAFRDEKKCNGNDKDMKGT